MAKVRVRFAPSPTGPLHIGGVRTALFNYLFAKKHGGDFILRIEDTDQNRYVEGAENYIIEALHWCGIPYDEGPNTTLWTPKTAGAFGPYRQSERKHLYGQYARELIANGHAYYAFDSPETLDFHRKDHEAKGKTFIYNWHNRLKLSNSLSLPEKTVRAKLDAGENYVIRFKSPENQEVTLQDAVRGAIHIETHTLDDKILFKSDGMPTYHLANVVDDHLMQITHVIRGEEWLPSLALHHLLYEAFEWKKPIFAHLPLILKPTGKGKLSKRDGEQGGFPIFPLAWEETSGYREAGYFPEAVVNFLALLGWNPGTEQELFSLDALIQAFSLERVNKSGARFDPEKIKWYNHQWLQRKNTGDLVRLFRTVLESKELPGPIPEDPFLEQVVSLLKERANFVADFWELGSYFFMAPSSFADKAVRKHWKENTKDIIQEVMERVADVQDFSTENLEKDIKDWIATWQLSFGKVMPPLRLAIVGDLKGPHLFDIMSLLGKEACLQRMRYAVDMLS